MSQILITKDKITNIASAIRTKLNESDTYTLDQMASKISSMSGGSYDYTVTFNDSTGTTKAKFSVNSGMSVNAPTNLSIDTWKNPSGTAVTFPYTPTGDIILTASRNDSKLGGRIFYDAGDNGATYTFYDSNGNVITDTSISGLANAYSYTILGTPSQDRWYIYEPNLTSVSTYKWGYITTLIGTKDGIGAGKTNTELIFEKGVPTDVTPNVWEYIAECRNNSLDGCNDWFLPSKSELSALNASGLTDFFTTQYLMTSVEYSNAIYWQWRNSGDWGYQNKKNYAAKPLIMRSF